MNKTEIPVQNECRLQLSKIGGIAYRNNSGVAYDSNGTPVRFGLGNDSAKINKVRKSTDLICCLPVEITPEMVGHTVGIMLVIDAKKPTWKYKESDKTATAQLNFIKQIRNLGGIGGFVTHINDLKYIINKWYERFK